jgi:cytochrome c oxidase subunit 3
MTVERRAVQDVSEYPDFAFGHRDPLWWGTMGFVVIEAMTLAVCFASYFYLARNEPVWPPPPAAMPSLGVSSVAVAVALLSILPAAGSARAARRYDHDSARRALIAHSLTGLLLLALRAAEFVGLGVRWDDHAYGSVVWFTLGVHSMVVLTDIADTLFATAIFLRHKEENKHFAGLVDNADYWYFVVASWVITYLIVFVGPFVMRS